MLGTREIASVRFEGAASVVVESATWHPRFGVTLPNFCLVARLSGATLATQVCWQQ